MAAALATIEGLLPPGWEKRNFTGFKPRARYYDAMDMILYLQEDLPYRADRVDQYLTLLWHPSEQRAIGVKLKGIRFLFNRLQAVVAPLGLTLTDKDFLPLVSLLELMMSVKSGATMTAEAERSRLDDRYEVAKRVIENAQLDTKEMTAVA